MSGAEPAGGPVDPEKEARKAAKLEAKAAKDAAKAARKAENLAKQGQGSLPEVPRLTQLTMNIEGENEYGYLFIQSAARTNRTFTHLAELSAAKADETVWIVARAQSSRAAGGKLCFLVLRTGLATAQAVVANNKAMATFAASLGKEAVVHVKAKVVKVDQPITSCSQQDVELAVVSLYCVSDAAPLPLQLEDANRPEAEFEKDPALVRVGQDTRLDNRVVDLRTATSHSICHISSGVCNLFREFLLSQGFVEIHTPKMIATASEGGADVFRVDYFNGNAYLAQSPQLYKQMALMADLGRVFELGPVFRSEKSFTHRHMTEFTGLDMEMTFVEHYHEVLDMLDQMFCSIFDGLNQRFRKELDTVRKQFPFEDLRYSYPSKRLTFEEAVALLKEHGPALLEADMATEQDDFRKKKLAEHLESVRAHEPLADIGTEDEKLLGRIMGKVHHTDFYIIDKFPIVLRPFYTMPDPDRPELGNAYDIFIRGEEVTSGAQRVHLPDLLLECAAKRGLDLTPIQPYVDAFKYGAYPHAGGGVGLERVVMLFMGLSNIRKTSMFPRDPSRLTP